MAYKQTPLNMGSSPLKGNYESGVDGIRYVSTAPAFQDMQNKIAGGSAKAIDGLKPKEPDTSKENNSSDYDSSITNNYYYGNQGKDKGRFNFDVDVPTVDKLEIKGFDPKDFPTTEGSGGGGSSNSLEKRSTTKNRLTHKQAWNQNIEGIRDIYKDYDSYVTNRKEQKAEDPKGYEADLFKKTGVPGRPGSLITEEENRNKEGWRVTGTTRTGSFKNN
jgi:hypothetical protein